MSYMMLTGATGLLGGYLLRDALREDLPVAVIVRRTAALTARRRIDAVLAPFETERALPRPVVLEGDLSRPGLGLSGEDRQWLADHCGSVLHSAASISFYREERSGEPYRTNVDGTQNLLKLCRELGIDEFHHVSTAYVCGRRNGRVLESDLEVGQEHGNDYEKSKVASEKMVLAAGFAQRPTIYRPSIIVGDSQTGYTTTFHGYYTPIQVAWWLAKAGVLQSNMDNWFLGQLGLAGHERKNIVPVDWVSRVILEIVRNRAAHGRNYHVTCDDPPNATDLAAAVGDVLKPHFQSGAGFQPASQALAAPTDLLDSADFRKHMDVYRAYFRDHPEFDTTNLRQAVPHVPCPPVDRAMLARTGKYALDHNFGWPRTQPPPAPVEIDRTTDLRSVASNFDGPEVRRTRTFQPVRVAQACIVEITGVGGGASTFDLESQQFLDRGRCENPAATIRLRSDTLAALAASDLTVDQALQSGRVLIAATPRESHLAVELLLSIASEARLPSQSDRRPSSRPSLALAENASE
jgi:nucleoside-diphosphate-sugar epimerase